MFFNYLITAWRNILRRKAFSMIMIAGLALSMSVCLLVIVIINDQFSFDTFHPNADRIYRVNTSITHTSGATENMATAPFPLGDVLKNNYSAIEDVVRADRDFNTAIQQGQSSVPLRGVFTEPSFFKVFGFSLQTGNPAVALNEPNSLVLTHETALKFFGTENPVGKILSLNKLGDFKITGVLKEISHHSQLQFEALASAASLPALEQKNIITPATHNLQSYYSGYVYVLLREGKSVADLNTILSETAANLRGANTDPNNKKIAYRAEHMTGVSSMSISNNAVPANVLWVLSLLGFIVILSACFNYTNLSVAASLSRSKEIGMRKTMGATRWNVFIQFILQSVIIALVSLVVAAVAWRFIGSGFQRIVPQLQLNLQVSSFVYVLFLLFSVFVGIIAGLFPAAYLSAFKPITVLKAGVQAKLFAKLPLRKALLLIQFTFCCVAVISISIINKQMNYVLHADYGFNRSNIINVDLQGMPYQYILNEAGKNSSITAVSASSGLPATGQPDEINIKQSTNGKATIVSSYSIDGHFLSNLHIPIVAGTNFPANAMQGKIRLILLNEQAVKAFGFANGAAATGKSLLLNDSNWAQVCGVVKDFNFLPLTNSIGPLVLRADAPDIKYLNIAFAPGRRAVAARFLADTWRRFDAVRPLSYSFYDDDISKVYQPYQSMLTALSFVGLLAVAITCMGLLGIVLFTVRMRQKEIAIRKVLGLSSVGILLLVSKSFLKLLVIATVIAIPLSILVGYAFLGEFAYQANIGVMTVVTGIALVFVLVLGTIFSQVVRAARLNPAKSLRAE